MEGKQQNSMYLFSKTRFTSKSTRQGTSVKSDVYFVVEASRSWLSKQAMKGHYMEGLVSKKARGQETKLSEKGRERLKCVGSSYY